MNKDKEIQRIDKCIAELVYDKEKLKKAYNYYHGKRDPEQFRHLTSNYGLGTPTSITFTPLIKKHIDVLVGEYLELDPDLQVTCKDKETVSSIMRDKQLEVEKQVMEFNTQYLKNSIIDIILKGKEPVNDPFYEQRIQEIKDHIDKDFISNYEVAAQDLLEFFKSSRDIDLKNKCQELFTDLLIGGVCYYDERPAAGKQGLTLKVLNPVDTFIERNPNSLYLNKSPRAVYRRWMTKDQILAEYGDELSAEAKRKLREETLVDAEASSTFVHSSGPFIIGPSAIQKDGILGGLEAICLPDFNHAAYTQGDNYICVYETQWIETDVDGIMQRHEGVRIGDEIYITRGINEDVPRSRSNPSECTLSINGLFFNDKNGQPFSMILSTADLQD